MQRLLKKSSKTLIQLIDVFDSHPLVDHPSTGPLYTMEELERCLYEQVSQPLDILISRQRAVLDVSMITFRIAGPSVYIKFHTIIHKRIGDLIIVR